MPETTLVTAEERFRMGEGRRELVRGRVVEMMPPGDPARSSRATPS